MVGPCPPDIPDIGGMPIPVRYYDEYYDPYSDEESWYDEDNYNDWDFDDYDDK